MVKVTSGETGGWFSKN